MRLGALERAQKDPRASTSTRWSGRSKGVAIVTAALLGAGGSILAAAPATAAPVASSGQGRFLSGSALGVNLDDLLTVTPADAANTGGATDTDVHPLDVTALNAVNVDLGGGLNLLGNNGILTLGAVNQYAAADADGSSVAASGAVTNTGGIGVGGQDGVPQSNATLDLSGLIGADLAGALANAQLEVGAVSATAAQAAGPGGAQIGDYGIAGLDLSLTSPALGTTVTGLRSTLGTLQPTVDGVEDTLNLLGPLVQVQGLPDLVTVLDSATGDVTSADGSITANLQTGAITVDVAAVLTNAGLDINDLPANTELLPYITNALTTQLLPAVTTALQGVVTQLTQSLRGLTVTAAGIPLPIGELLDVVNPVIEQVVAPISQVVAGLGETVVTPLAGALTTVVSLQANVQETSADGVFTQRALRVALVPAAGTAVVNLASAAVGPNAGPLAVPTITTLDPDNGPVAGGTVVTVTGTGFTDDATVSVDGSDPIEADSVSDDGTELTFTTPAHVAGTVDVTVTTPAGTSGPLDFTYDPATAAVPTITTLDPDNGPVGGGTLVTVTGTGFTDDATVSVDGSDPIEPESVSDDGTELTFTTPAHVAGPVDVTVTTDAGTSDPLTYTYDPAPAGAPTLTALDPDSGPVTGGTVVTVSGTGFTDASTVSVDGSDPITPDSVSDDGTELTFTTPAHTAGAVPVTVTNGSGTSAPLPYTYNPAPAAVPTLSALDPDNGPAAGGTVVTVTGTGFTDDSTVSVDGSEPITPDSVSADGTTLTFTTPAHAAGDVEVTVTTPGGTSDPLVYTYNAASTTTPPPVITSPEDGGTVTTPTPPITGTGQPGAVVTVTVGTVVVCTAVVAADGTWKCTPIVGFGPGTVTITAAQTGADGTSAASDPVTFTVRAVAAGSGGAGATGGNGTLAYTGSDPAPAIALAVLLMLAGAGLTIARRFRRA